MTGLGLVAICVWVAAVLLIALYFSPEGTDQQ